MVVQKNVHVTIDLTEWETELLRTLLNVNEAAERENPPLSKELERFRSDLFCQLPSGD